MRDSVKLWRLIRFGDFEVDLRSGELRREGQRVPLPEQSFQILAVLLEQPGELVSRAAIQKRLWPNDTVVEFENSISAAVKRLRMALGDSADQPRYLETLPRRGYRWMVPVERVETDPGPLQPGTTILSLQPEPATSNLIGKRVSHYRVLEILGGGGMGVVYKAEDLKLGRRVALKFLPEELAGDSSARERFAHEARAASALSHPNICTIYEIEEHEAQLFIVMELLEGETLRELINAAAATSSPLPLTKVLDLATQITEGLNAAHRKGIIHRDIKPANILVTAQGQAKILDFGLAKVAAGITEEILHETASGPGGEYRESAETGSNGRYELSLSRTGLAMGTAGYMSPEQVRGEKLDARTDIFSLGLVLYEMTTGQRAFTGNTTALLQDSIVHHTPLAVRQLNPGIPPKLEALIRRALEKDRDARYSSTAAILEELRLVAEAAGSAAEGVPKPLVFEPSSKPWLAATIGLVMLAMVALFVGYYVRQRQARRLTPQDSIVLADFANSTGDTIFDDTLKPALRSALRQSPFLNILSDARVSKTLAMMRRPSNTPLNPTVAREVCMREQSKVYIAGAIAALGSEYVIGLKAVDCASGETVAHQQITAESKDKVLNALGSAATKLREELGESLATVAKFDVPLDQTTSSLEALRTYNLGMKAGDQGPAGELPYDLRAIQLDPNFAMAYLSAAETYTNLNQGARAIEYFTRAFQLRDHANAREKLEIESQYYAYVTGELEKAAQTYQKTIEIYPKSPAPYGNLSMVYAEQGRYERATELARQVLQVYANFGGEAYEGIAEDLLPLQRFDEARQVLQAALNRKVDTDGIHKDLYALGFLEGNSSAMAEQSEWLESKAEYENLGLSLQSDTEAYAGQLGKARELTRRAVASAMRTDNKEAAAIWQTNAALREALFGNRVQARQYAGEALRTGPSSQQVEIEAALTFAMVGDNGRAEGLARGLAKSFPLHTLVQSKWLPTIDAQLALGRRKPADALDRLQVVVPMELGNVAFTTSISCLYPVYVRGEAYLAAGNSTAAASEFQKILDHNGIVWNCPTGALARVGLARANALQAETDQGVAADAARTRARAAYQDFFALWKDADPDIPILKQAKAEYAKLR